MRTWVRDVAAGLAYLASAGVAHGDVKPANLLLSSEGIVKLADFGSAALFRESGEVCDAIVLVTYLGVLWFLLCGLILIGWYTLTPGVRARSCNMQRTKCALV